MKVPCPHCGKMLSDRNGVYSHIKAKHNGKGKAAYAPKPDEESYADRAIEAQMQRDAGTPNEDDWLLG